MSAEMKSGYKQTEVGLIPEDWEVKNLGECLASTPRYGINAAAVPYSDRLPVYIRITDISTDGRFAPEKPVSVDNPQASNYYLLDGDIVLARTGASVGKSYKYETSDGPLVFAGFLILIRPNPTKLVPGYISSYLSSKMYWDWVGLMSMRSGQPGINGKEYSQLPLPIPSISEQHEISIALSDVEDLIKSLDKLIAKKRDIQQATMQQLLTCHRRLPGFSGEWEVKRLGDFGQCLRGVSYKGDADLLPYDTDETYRLLRSNNVQQSAIDTDGLQFVNARCVSNYQVLKPNDILICMANGSKDLVGKAGLFKVSDGHRYTFGAFMGCFRMKAGAEPGFIFSLFGTKKYRNYIANLLAGSSINNLRPSDIEQMEFSFPSKNEQAAIATILSDMDNELSALEGRRDKARQIKQGMMQVLLTGRIRLSYES